MYLFKKIRSHFVTGVVVVGPLALTVYLGYAFLNWVDEIVKPFVPVNWDPSLYLQVDIPGFGLLFSVVFLTVLGGVTASILGRWMVVCSERVVERVPLVSSVHKTIKQIFEALMSDKGKKFSHVGLIQWPRRGVWSIVFVARAAQGEINTRLGGEYLTVFVPTTPNPTGGYLTFVPRGEVMILDMTLEEAAKVILSAGLVVPVWDEKAMLEG